MRTTRANDRRIASLLESWFEHHARDLPWRAVDPRLGRRDAYLSLVSEVMLQQTQVSRVLEKYTPFIERFPTLRHLARAREQSVLAAWSGLGYYRRARNLHQAAKQVVLDHHAEVPSDPAALRQLPGVGRYTAGAIASMVFGLREPIVDGNVRRVLLRIEGRAADRTPRDTDRWAWSRASELVAASSRAGVLNEALMELGATVCTPANPKCDRCPIASRCAFHNNGRLPRRAAARPSIARRPLYLSSVIIEDTRGRVLLQQRPDRGLWASMWQAPTIERDDRHASRAELINAFALRSARRVGAFDHATTSRLVRFQVWIAAPRPSVHRSGRWLLRRDLLKIPLSNPQRRILSMHPDHPPDRVVQNSPEVITGTTSKSTRSAQ